MVGIQSRLRYALKTALRRAGYRFSKVERFNVFEPLLYRRLKSVDEFFLVSIGANDGRMADPVYWFIGRNRSRVRGLLIEPMKDAFEELCRTYQDYPRLTPLNFAIHNTEKKMELYRVDPTRLKGLPAWSKGIASFNPEHHKLSGTPTEEIITETVECVSLSELIEDHKIDTIDLLQIDTEGYDSEIILGLDFERIKPAVIHFEHGLEVGVMSPETFLKVVSRLSSNGYGLAMERSDATAYLLDLFLP